MKRSCQAIITGSAAVLALLTMPHANACDAGVVHGHFQFVPMHAPPLVAQDMPPTVDAAGNPTIVGMWNSQFISEGNLQHDPPIPNGIVLDFGNVQWHNDSTEMYNSGGRAPAAENFCMGVWNQDSSGTYHLNHFAYSYDATTGALENSTNIQETITLGPNGNSYIGALKITTYDLNGNQVDQVTGKVTGVRLTVFSPVPPVPQM